MKARIILCYILTSFLISSSQSQNNDMLADDCFQSIRSSIEQSREGVCSTCANEPCVIIPPPCLTSLGEKSYFLFNGLHLSDLLSKDGTALQQFIFSTSFTLDYTGYHFQELAVEIFESYTLMYKSVPGNRSGEITMTKLLHENDSVVESIRANILSLSDSMDHIVLSCSGNLPDALVNEFSKRNTYSLSVYKHGILDFYYENWWYKDNPVKDEKDLPLKTKLFNLFMLIDSICSIPHQKMIKAALERQ